ncbi:ABC-type branched-subunit amino acid transport system substrate-binding protein [Neolewinella xylanilytica]|uniref:ABC-type branched-subunit amino acid transport system substrate-binding protein n=1 Tax=Neolewinella xylanilytica TaxID=1514080 RepID=A0A2S6I4B1_9BACT|nr:ABC transporter substrate-binding protein [Neolewinella xylanilytica]PPK86010.1 ABC-type branched-subunit amino acid transport system substrate-binding protein [Neolewinella xylanilytica]
MTSVPSHRQLLSGNSIPRYWLLALLLTTVASSCELFRPVGSTGSNPSTRPDRSDGDLDAVQSRRVFDEESGTYVYVNAPTQPMDTIEWEAISAEENPPIGMDTQYVFSPGTTDSPAAPGLPPVRQLGTGRNGSRLLSGYGVDFVLPFLSDRNPESASTVDPNSLWALHFYSGAELALDDLREEDGEISYDVRVQDSRANPAQVRTILASPEYERSQLIIGPYLKENVTLLAEAVDGQEKVLISPYSAATGISDQNVNYIQVNPTLETHLRELLGHAFRTQGADRIVLVAPQGQRARLAYFQDEYRLLTGDDQIEPLEELLIGEEVPALDSLLDGRRTVFLVPVYDNETFVANFLRQVYQATIEEQGDNVAVYGLPQWADFERLNPEFLENTNVHISSSVFIDPLDEDVQEFRNRFYERYATLPRDEAYIGYDISRYFLKMAARYGTRFQFELENNPEDLIHTSFRFAPVAVIPAGAANLEETVIDRFENRFVNILKYTDYAFKRVN